MLVKRSRLLGGVYAALLALAITAATHAATPVLRPTTPPAAAHGPLCLVPPYAGYVNHANAVPAFQWGHFGAERRYPRVNWGRDYNGEWLRWSQFRRY